MGDAFADADQAFFEGGVGGGVGFELFEQVEDQVGPGVGVGGGQGDVVGGVFEELDDLGVLVGFEAVDVVGGVGLGLVLVCGDFGHGGLRRG